jgi:hypothetical protein
MAETRRVHPLVYALSAVIVFSSVAPHVGQWLVV